LLIVGGALFKKVAGYTDGELTSGVRGFHRRRPAITTTAAAVAAATAAAIAAASTATAATEAATTTATTTTAAAIFARTRFVDRQVATVEVLTVELLDGRLAFFIRRHFDETETARTTRLPIFYHRSRLDCTRLRKKLLQIFARSLEREITDVKFHGHVDVPLLSAGVSGRSCESKWLRCNGWQRRLAFGCSHNESGF
jgi:hypothetical protein